MDDNEAIARLKRGDIGGLEQLVRRYQVRALRAAFLVVRDKATAEDLVQNAFLRVYSRIEQFDATRPFEPWFLRIVANDAMKAAARGGRQVPLEDEADEDLFASPGPPDPLSLVEQAETSAAIWATLGELTPQQRTAVVLRYYLGLSEAEMAARLDTPPGTIKSRLHAARERLRQLLPGWLSLPPS